MRTSGCYYRGVRKSRRKIDPAQSDAYYHLISRSVAGEWLLGRVEREVLRQLVWRVADRLGLDIITYAILSNHLHIVVRAPKRTPLTDAELLRRYRVLHSGRFRWEQRSIDEIEAMLAENGEPAAAWRSTEMDKMSDISEYMKLLKQRFSIWYNQRHRRFGTAWAERFTSVLIESGRAVLSTALYVDLNAFRAGLCKDPKDYRFSGYAEAVAGHRGAQAGLLLATGFSDWAVLGRVYRLTLLRAMAGPAKSNAQVLSSSELAEALAMDGMIPNLELLRCRCRYFTQSLVLGSEAFVSRQLDRLRMETGQGQQMRPRRYPGLGPELTTLVRLRGETAIA